MKPSGAKRRPKSKRKPMPAGRSVLDLNAKQARSFFLKPESYCRLELPPYFDFKPVLRPVEKILAGRSMASLGLKPRAFEDVNYTIYSNKDGRYAWRPFQLIHPILYVDLVRQLTQTDAWTVVRSRFAKFARNPKILCLSLPRESLTTGKDQGAQVHHWWQGIEQRSIELALDFHHVLHADIADCYASVYTHSVAWAMHGRATAKEKRGDDALLGNAIDKRIQDMRNGQTNGIPQGSVLLDLIAEMVLGYADLELGKKLTKAGHIDYHILRYRDDYRIFVNDSRVGELVLKALTETLIDLGLRLNVSKTTGPQAVIETSLKVDKREWLRRRQGDRNLQKHMLLIHSHGLDFPNAGSLLVALDVFNRRISPLATIPNPMQLISIAVDIGYISPRCFPVCAAIVSKLLSTLPARKERLIAFHRIRKRLAQLPNNGHLEVWLQRIGYPIDPSLTYEEKLCVLVEGKVVSLWNSSWVTDAALKATVNPQRIVNRRRLKDAPPILRRNEFVLFTTY